MPTVETLQAFAEAWNRHDVDALMDFMTDDCRFEASAGPQQCGAAYAGQEQVRAAFSQVWRAYPDAQWRSARHFVCGDRGVSEWTFTGTAADGTRTEVNGCDVFTLPRRQDRPQELVPQEPSCLAAAVRRRRTSLWAARSRRAPRPARHAAA
jgi:steroid delta-isomerase-like uncharacterized protein